MSEQCCIKLSLLSICLSTSCTLNEKRYIKTYRTIINQFRINPLYQIISIHILLFFFINLYWLLFLFAKIQIIFELPVFYMLNNKIRLLNNIMIFQEKEYDENKSNNNHNWKPYRKQYHPPR